MKKKKIEYQSLLDADGNPQYDEDGELAVDETKPLYYSTEGTWAVTDESLRYAQIIELEETRVLPAPAILGDKDGNGELDSHEYNADATEAIKQELMNGRAVSIAFCADQSIPGQVTEQGYMNPDTWAHYTYTPESANHAVTIVGWDDNYDASNFTAEHQPSQNGAWIVKNSWGSDDNDFPNKMNWGVDGSGYFYLSYYDQSIVSAETFDYDIESIDSEKESYYNNTYDYLPTSTSFNETSTDKISTANVFAAEGDQTVRTLACETTLPNTTVTYELYKLNENHTGPTDGTKVAEITETYEYGGFHRVDLTEEQQLKVPQDSTFSVVVTQKSGDTYYYTLDGGYNKTYIDWYNAELQKQYDLYYGDAIESIALSSFESEKGYPYDAENGTEEDKAAYQEYIDAAWDIFKMLGMVSYAETYSAAVVGEGESHLYQNGQWVDETDVLAGLDEDTNKYIDFDNFSIKAYSDDTPLSDKDLVDELGGTIESAEVLAGSVHVSADGSDVPSDEYWATQDVLDALNAAVAEAKQVHDAAVADWTQVTIVAGSYRLYTVSNEQLIFLQLVALLPASRETMKISGKFFIFIFLMREMVKYQWRCAAYS